MIKIRGLLLVLAVLGAPVTLDAQRPARGEPERSEPGRHGPVEMLLRDRERLGLDAQQVVRLEEIARRMEERNRPLVARLLEMRRQIRAEFPVPSEEMSPPQREEFRRRLKDAHPLLREIRQNNDAAMREVGEVLTPPQKEQVREILREHRKKRGHGDERKRRGSPL